MKKNNVLPGIAKRKGPLYGLMLTWLYLLLLFLIRLLRSCSDTAAEADKYFLSDLQLQEHHTVFGHQDALAYGVGWTGISGNSDVKAVAGDYPGLYGWDFGHLEMQKEANLDNVSFRDMKKYIREGFERGGIITISWHLRNPLTGGSAWDTAKVQ
jgi:mannan endo-1,4-beta-mannosidase